MAHSVETRFVGIDSILAASVLNQRPQSSVLQYLPLRPSHAAFDTKFGTSLALGISLLQFASVLSLTTRFAGLCTSS